jgi:uncharacterized protein (TIGR00369 family)
MTFYKQLVKMYLDAPIQKLYPGISMTVAKHQAEITLPTGESFHHAGKSMHGSVYFRLLDDACYFSAMSVVKDCFLLTKSFNIEFLRPHIEGKITANARLIEEDNEKFYCEGELFNDAGKIIARGSGVFVRSKMPLKNLLKY